MAAANSLQLETSDERYDKSAKLQQQSFETFFTADQILYKESHTTLIPKTYNQISIDGDVIALGTRFDRQACFGDFGVSGSDFLGANSTAYSPSVKEFGLQVVTSMGLRDRYQDVSLQHSADNPLNKDTWKSYPPPQPKFWHYEDEYGATEYYFDENALPHYSGETFEIAEYENFFRTNNTEAEAEKRPLHWTKASSLEIEGFHANVPTFKQFFNDLKHVIDTSINKTGNFLAERRLVYLKAKFESYLLLNEHREMFLTKLNPHRDFYNIRKVDNNIDISMCMTKKHLLNVINKKLKDEPDRVVYNENGVQMTLMDIFKPYFENGEFQRLNIDDLFELGIIDRNFTGDIVVLDDHTSYESIIQKQSLLRVDKTFLRIDNEVNGEYLSEILKQVFSDLEKSKYCFAELGLSFNLLSNYDKSGGTRWSSLANWIVGQQLISYNVKWIIRIPRNYSALKQAGKVKSFKDFLDLIFRELFEVSLNPNKNIKLHYFLTKISSFDLLSGGISKENRSIFDFKRLTSPKKWISDENPPYCYYLYYIFLNLSNLNKFRASKGLCSFNLRPHVASVTEESGAGIMTESLAANFLLSKDIINGEQLVNYSVLQYLYYLKQVGITMSPLCWNKTIQTLNDDDRKIGSTSDSYETNPCVKFFQTGMKVSLSTNKPLFSAMTREPLIEEYSIAGSIHKLSGVDLCELGRNSVLISGFNGLLKRHWIGINYTKDAGVMDYEFSDEFSIQRSNVPPMRLDYRRDTLLLEHHFVDSLVN